MERKKADHYCYANSDALINSFDIREVELVEALEEKLVVTKMASAIEAVNSTANLADAPWVAHRNLFSTLYKWAGKARTADLDSSLSTTPAAFAGSSGQIVFNQSIKLAEAGKLKEALVFLALGFERVRPFRSGTSGAMAACFAALAGRPDAPNHDVIALAARESLEQRTETAIERAVQDYLG